MNLLSDSRDSARIKEALSLIGVGYAFSMNNIGSELASIRAAQFLWASRLLLVGGFMSILASFAACFVRYFVDPSAPPDSATWWTALALGNALLSTIGWIYISRPGRSYKEWYFSSLFAVSCVGFMWGFLPFWLFPIESSQFHNFAITLMIGAASLSAVFCFSAIHASTSYIILAAAPFMVIKAGSSDLMDMNWVGWGFFFNLLLLAVVHALFYVFVKHFIQENTLRTISSHFEEKSSDWRWEIDSTGRLVYLSEKMLALKPDSGERLLQGGALQDYLDRGHHGCIRITELIERQQSFSNVIAKGVSTGTSDNDRWWSVSSTVLKDFQGRYVGAAGICSDISRSMNIQQIEEEKTRLDSIAQMSSTIAHDFNNNLMSIQGFVDLVNAFPTEASRYAHLAPAVQVSVTRSSRMIEQLLSYVKRDSMQVEAINLDALLQGCVKESRLSFDESIDLEFVSGFDVDLLTDSMLLQRAVMNLIRNAAETPGPEKKVVRVFTTQIEGGLSERRVESIHGESYVCIVIEDNGGGIGEEHIGKIFEPFYTSKRQNHGTGLGLSMVKGFAEQSGGYVTAANTGVGARFTLTLPIKVENVHKVKPRARSITETSLLDVRMLIVEDNEPYLEVLCSTARNDGAIVKTASSMAGGVAILKQADKLDVLVTDLLLPDGLGTDLSTLAKSLHPKIAIVAITAFDNQLWSKHKQLDNAIMLKKPFHYSRLRSEILHLLEWRKKAVKKRSAVVG